MNKDLFLSLINKGVIAENTALTAKYKAKALGGISHNIMEGIFLFQEIREIEGNQYIVAKKPYVETTHAFYFDSIILVDGMEPERLAGIYGLKNDGSEKKVKIDPITGLPVRRGRKPKKVKEMINEQLKRSKQGTTTKRRNTEA